MTFPGQQRTDNPKAGPHCRHKFVRCCRVDDIGGREGDPLPAHFGVTAPPSMHGDVDAVIFEDAFELLDVCQARHVDEHQRLFGQKRGDHQGQSRVLGARDVDFAIELIATHDADAVHMALLGQGFLRESSWNRRCEG